jgi:hypothetical protein
MKKENTIKAVDLDGTLAKQLIPHNPKVAGPPIPKMLQLVKRWLKAGETVVIFTSRVSPSTHNIVEIRYARKLITAWCREYLGTTLAITSDKNPRFEIWDNKAHRVETNTGRVLAKAVEKAYLTGRKEGREWAEDSHWSMYD